MKRKIILVGLVMVALAGVYFSVQWYKQSQLIKAITPHVKNVSLRTTNSLNYDINDNTNITYKELLEKIDADISEADKRILEVQTLTTSLKQANTDIVISYLRGCQELLRAQSAKYRKH